MLAARQQDPETMRRPYESVAEIIFSIDGLQPEEGHETLSVVREPRGYPEKNSFDTKELRLTLNMARCGGRLELQGNPKHLLSFMHCNPL